MGEGGLGGRSRRSVKGGRGRLRKVGVRGGGVSRVEGFPIAIPEHTVGLGDVSTEPKERGLSVTKGEALEIRAERLPERGGPVP